MRYELMFPDQIRKALDKDWPAAMAVGVLEYHSEHCCVGVDTLLVTKAIEELEKKMDMVVLPPFYYAAGSYVVNSPERNGTVHVPPATLLPFAKDLFRSLLRIGFRNLHVFIHHQSENFSDGMPTDLAFKLGAREAIFEFLEKTRGESWWGDSSMQDYYKSSAVNDNPFSWIRIHPFINEACQKEFPIDHAGEQETSLMMAFCPEGVDMKRFTDENWYAKAAMHANLEYGAKARKMILDGIEKALRQQ
ncbi:MAG: creatininase family protein [Victivallales bacterium]|nr:creatininase family protein [Victivallales bacterium]